MSGLFDRDPLVQTPEGLGGHLSIGAQTPIQTTMEGGPMKNETFRVPARREGIKLRKAEPVGYDPATSKVYKFNPTAYQILSLVDGQRHEHEIATAVAGGDDVLADELLPEFRTFLDRCASDGLIVWREP
jgi:hypothetical protein